MPCFGNNMVQIPFWGLYYKSSFCSHLRHSSPHTLASYKTAGGGVTFLPYNVLFCNILPFLLVPVCPFWTQIQETGITCVSLISLITYKNKCSQRLFSTVISKNYTNLLSKNVILLVNSSRNRALRKLHFLHLVSCNSSSGVCVHTHTKKNHSQSLMFSRLETVFLCFFHLVSSAFFSVPATDFSTLHVSCSAATFAPSFTEHLQDQNTLLQDQ